MPYLEHYYLNNYGLDGPLNDTNTRTTIVESRLSNNVGSSDTSLYTALGPITIPAINKYLDVYSPEPEKSISLVGSFLIYLSFYASNTMYFSSSQYIEASLILTDDKGGDFKFLSSKSYGNNFSGVMPQTDLRLTSLSIDKENRKLYWAGFTKSAGSTVQSGTVDIPSTFNLDGILTLKNGGQKNYTDGGIHTLIFERRQLTILTS